MTKKPTQDTIEFLEDEVDHIWDEVVFDEQRQVWVVSGIQGYRVVAEVKAADASHAVELAEELYGDNA